MIKMGGHIDRDMIRNVFETDIREAYELITLPALICVLIFGIILAILICKSKIEFGSFKSKCLKRLCSIVNHVIFKHYFSRS